MNIQGGEEWRLLYELRQFCLIGDVSVEALRARIASTPQSVIDRSFIIHCVCVNKSVTPEIVEYLLRVFPQAATQRDDGNDLPIHLICNYYVGMDDVSALDALAQLIEASPTSVREVDGDGSLPIHLAAVSSKSAEFCKLLVEAYPESLTVRSGSGELPIHNACQFAQFDTVKYLLEMYSESVSIKTRRNNLPLHHACMRWRCGTPKLQVIRLLFDAHPEATLARNDAGETPLDCARRYEEVNEAKQEVIQFLEAQMVYARTAQDVTAVTTPDANGWLPLHQALRDNATLGAIKLLARAYPAALEAADLTGSLPFHIACQYSSADVVKYLLELDDTLLNHCDSSGNSTLHYACRGGNCGVVKLLLERNVPSVSDQNADSKLPIHLLGESDTVDHNSVEYLDSIWRLLLAYPMTVSGLLSSSAQSQREMPAMSILRSCQQIDWVLSFFVLIVSFVVAIRAIY